MAIPSSIKSLYVFGSEGLLLSDVTLGWWHLDEGRYKHKRRRPYDHDTPLDSCKDRGRLGEAM